MTSFILFLILTFTSSALCVTLALELHDSKKTYPNITAMLVVLILASITGLLLHAAALFQGVR